MTPIKIEIPNHKALFLKMHNYTEKGWQTCCILSFIQFFLLKTTISLVNQSWRKKEFLRLQSILTVILCLCISIPSLHFSEMNKKNINPGITAETKFIVKEKVLTGCRCDIRRLRSWKQKKWTVIRECVCMKKSLLYLVKLNNIFDNIIMEKSHTVSSKIELHFW